MSWFSVLNVFVSLAFSSIHSKKCSFKYRLMVLYGINKILSCSLYIYFIFGLLCLIVFECSPSIFVDYWQILTNTISVSDIKMFVKSMLKAKWWDWFLITLSKYTKYSVMQNSLIMKLSVLIMIHLRGGSLMSNIFKEYHFSEWYNQSKSKG